MVKERRGRKRKPNEKKNILASKEKNNEREKLVSKTGKE